MNNRYVGWIPCLSGTIYFHDVKPGLGDFDKYKFVQARVNEKPGKFCLSSVVDLRDTKSRFPTKQMMFRIAVMAQINEAGTCAGNLYIIDRTLEKDVDIDSNSKKPFPHKNSYSEFKLLKKLKGYDESSPEAFDQSFLEVVNSLENKFDLYNHKLSFSILSDGICELNYIQSRDPLGKQYKPTKIETLDDEPIAVIANQAFFYLKYSLHNHRHHEDEDDCLTMVHLRSENEEVNAGLLLDDLKKALSAIRFSYKRSFHSYSGIALYGMSLLTTLAKREWVIEAAYLDSEKHYFSNMKKSIELLGLSETESNVGLMGEFKNMFKSSSVYLLALIAPVLVFLNTASRHTDHSKILDKEEQSICPNLAPIVDSICSYTYKQVHEYIEGGFLPSVKIIILVTILAIWISFLRIAGDHYLGGRKISNGIFAAFRDKANSDGGLFGNNCYKIIMLDIYRRNFVNSLIKPQSKTTNRFFLFFSVFLFLLAPYVLVKGLLAIGDAIPG